MREQQGVPDSVHDVHMSPEGTGTTRQVKGMHRWCLNACRLWCTCELTQGSAGRDPSVQQGPGGALAGG